MRWSDIYFCSGHVILMMIAFIKRKNEAACVADKSSEETTLSRCKSFLIVISPKWKCLTTVWAGPVILFIKTECLGVKCPCLQNLFKNFYNFLVILSHIHSFTLPLIYNVFGRKKLWGLILIYTAFCSATHPRNHYIPNLIWGLLHIY